MASSSVGGSRLTRRGPYLVFQSSLIGASHHMRRYLGVLMLHCNMKLQWQYSHALQFLQPGRVVDLKRRGGGGERLQGADEIARGRHGKMSQQRGAVRPLLDKHQSQRVLAVDMHRMRDASRLFPRALDMLEAQLQHLVQG